MKKLFALSLAIFVMLSLWACSAAPDATEPETEPAAEEKTIYTGRIDGSEILLILTETTASIGYVDSSEDWAANLEQVGLTGTLYMKYVTTQPFGKFTITGDSVVLSNPGEARYTYYHLEGSAADTFKEPYKALIEQRYADQKITEERYESALARLSGREIYKNDVAANSNEVWTFHLLESGLIDSVMREDETGTTRTDVVYDGSMITQETTFYISQLTEDTPHAIVSTYYPGGNIVKTKEDYYIQETAAMEWELAGKISSTEYRQDGTMERVTYYYIDGNLCGVEEFNEAGIPVVSTYYFDNGDIKQLCEYENGELRQMTYFDRDGSWTICNYDAKKLIRKENHYVEGNWDVYEYFEGGHTFSAYSTDGSWYQYLFFANGEPKYYVSHNTDGTEDIAEWYENGEQKFTKNYLDDGWYEIYEYYENGLLALSQICSETDEVITFMEYTYEFDDDGKMTKRIVYGEPFLHLNQEQCSIEVFEYYDTGELKTETWYESHSNVNDMRLYRVTEYYKNGNTMRITEYDSYGGVASVEEYDEEGNLIWKG